MFGQYRSHFVSRAVRSFVCSIFLSSLVISMYWTNFVKNSLAQYITEMCILRFGSWFINPIANKPWFLRVCRTSLFKNTEGKGEIARHEQFLLFPQCFLPIWLTLCYFHQIYYFCLQTLSVWKSLKFDVWERVKFSLSYCPLMRFLFKDQYLGKDLLWQGYSSPLVLVLVSFCR